jgi:hypothetical protein
MNENLDAAVLEKKIDSTRNNRIQSFTPFFREGVTCSHQAM